MRARPRSSGFLALVLGALPLACGAPFTSTSDSTGTTGAGGTTSSVGSSTGGHGGGGHGGTGGLRVGRDGGDAPCPIPGDQHIARPARGQQGIGGEQLLRHGMTP